MRYEPLSMSNHTTNDFLTTEQMNEYIQNKHARATRYAYFRSLARFIGYLCFRAPMLVSAELLNNLNDELHQFDNDEYENEEDREAV